MSYEYSNKSLSLDQLNKLRYKSVKKFYEEDKAKSSGNFSKEEEILRSELEQDKIMGTEEDDKIKGIQKKEDMSKLNFETKYFDLSNKFMGRNATISGYIKSPYFVFEYNVLKEDKEKLKEILFGQIAVSNSYHELLEIVTLKSQAVLSKLRGKEIIEEDNNILKIPTCIFDYYPFGLYNSNHLMFSHDGETIKGIEIEVLDNKEFKFPDGYCGFMNLKSLRKRRIDMFGSILYFITTSLHQYELYEKSLFFTIDISPYEDEDSCPVLKKVYDEEGNIYNIDTIDILGDISYIVFNNEKIDNLEKLKEFLQNGVVNDDDLNTMNIKKKYFFEYDISGSELFEEIFIQEFVINVEQFNYGYHLFEQ